MDLLKSFSVTIAMILVISAIPFTSANDKDISKPAKIPYMSDFSTPQLEPGETGILEFSIENRYSATMNFVILTMEIYRYANIHESKKLSRVNDPPTILNPGKFEFKNDDNRSKYESCEELLSDGYFFNTSRSQSKSWVWSEIDPGEGNKTYVSARIITDEETEEGTYFVRFNLSFCYNGTHYTMKSRGHFTKEQWESATSTAHENTTETGNIDIVQLDVHGIIPDTTFGVDKPWPRWPLYVLGGLTVMFAVLAILTYMYEENTNPGFTRWVHKQQRKLDEYRAVTLHELGKFKRRNNK